LVSCRRYHREEGLYDIIIFGKITAIADVFDAMTTDRVYRKAYSAFDAFKEMLAMPLDQKLLKSFIALLGPDTSH
jgi:HD-GYP domain-containing protein (c-di-GMP phosphodiesterase class II)